ncbi:MAG: glycosyltransferase family 1 protein, partial [Chloroflexota bacterium]
ADFVLPPLRKRVKTIVTIHDLSFVRLPETTMPGMSQHLNSWVPRSVHKADHIIAVSEATRQDLVELYQTPPEKISVIYHGVTPNFKPITSPEALAAVRKKYGLGDTPFLLSVGTIQPRKNYQRLIEVLAQIDQPIDLAIIGGNGWSNEAVFNEVARQNLENRVHFLGFVDDADLPTLYSAATLFIYPSLYEGFGMPLLEAMACGLPIISSNRSAMPEVVGAAGLLVDPYDTAGMVTAITKLLEDSSQRHYLAEAGKARVAEFTWGHMATQLQALYEKVLKE